jgi:hypothetical protein
MGWGSFAPPPASLPASSPDLGFVDFSEHHQHLPEFHPHHLHHHHHHRHRHDDDDDDASDKTGNATTTTNTTTTPGCDTPEEDLSSPTVLPFFCSIGGRETASSDAALNKTSAKLNRYTTTTTTVHKSTVHLNKKVTVQLEKLPMIFSSDSSSGGSERKRRLAAVSQLPLAGSSKCARLEPAAPTNTNLVRTKDLNVSSVADVLNSFRICKPKPASTVVAAAGAKQNFPSFEPLSFYKKPSAGGSGSYPTLNRSSNCSYSASEILLRKDISADAQNQSSVSSPSLESETIAVTTDSTTTTNSCLKSNFNASSGPTATAAAVASAATTVNNNNVKFSASHEAVASPAAAVKATAVLGDGPAKALPGSEDFARPFRFPTVPGNHSAIPCKWEACNQGFKTHGKLSDHIKVKLRNAGPFLARSGSAYRQCWGYMTFWCGFGSGSPDPYL